MYVIEKQWWSLMNVKSFVLIQCSVFPTGELSTDPASTSAPPTKRQRRPPKTVLPPITAMKTQTMATASPRLWAWPPPFRLPSQNRLTLNEQRCERESWTAKIYVKTIIFVFQALIRALEPHGVFESQEELNHRMEVLAKLNSLVTNWIKDLSVERKMPPSVAETVGGSVYTFGSYRCNNHASLISWKTWKTIIHFCRLGVHNKGADIDTLCVTPRHIQREDYFTSFVEILRSQSEVGEKLSNHYQMYTTE